MEKVYLGKVRKDYAEKDSYVEGEMVSLEKHSWEHGWYWGFGYIGNKNLHTHFESAFLGSETDITKIFESTSLTQKTWWILRDLFVQAYALKKCAEVYQHGGHQTSQKGVTDLIQNVDMANQLNKDLEIILNKIWEIVQKP